MFKVEMSILTLKTLSKFKIAQYTIFYKYASMLRKSLITSSKGEFLPRINCFKIKCFIQGLDSNILN
jgi:hypothetical protein